MEEKRRGFLYWAPRILSMLFIALLAVMSLDAVSSGQALLSLLTGLFMHNIPTLAALLVLILSWKWEWIGGIVYLFGGAGYAAYTAYTAGPGKWPEWISWNLAVTLPCFLIGILFLVCWAAKTKRPA